MDPAADDGRSPSPVTDPDDGDGGSDKPPTRVEVVGKAAMEPSPSPPDSTVSDDQGTRPAPRPLRSQAPTAGGIGSDPVRFTHFDLPVALSSPPGTPALDPEDGGGSDDLTRAVSLLSLAEAGLTLTAPAPWIRPPTVTKGDQVSDSEATVVLVVPQPCCGMLIGKGGSVINQKLQ
uniref:K Homology domain-containing protein n=1 Tax=Aegilops tauschii subsp. strangulata TaxID=200361 RepID=A0A453TEI8_AEGTS